MSTALDRRREHITALFPEWTERSLGDWLAFCAQRYADRPLVITGDRTTTYAEIDAWATRLADGLVALGLKPGEHVGIVMANYTEFVPVKFAVARAGGVAVPMNFLYKEEELKYVLGQSECRVLITMTGYADMDYPQMLDNIVPGWDSGAVSEELPLLRDVILFSTDGRTRAGRANDRRSRHARSGRTPAQPRDSTSTRARSPTFSTPPARRDRPRA